ncbi:MAG TPA: alpha/beta fold hydrolase [Pyrinomonadaceae bacterium]|nr:alpha/beta fold hydrolase [Pyrinomonadaceae bacterium]
MANEHASPPTLPPRGAPGARLRAIAHALESRPFKPHRLFRNGHAQTIFAALTRSQRLVRLRDYLRADEPRLFDVEPGVRLLAHCQWQSERRAAPVVLLVHGLEGSTDSAYMVGTAHKAFRAGFNVVRLNMRNCGGTEHLTHTLYHSGMSGDIRAVVRELVESDKFTSLYVTGFSMGGNIVLKFAGEYGDEAPVELSGVCAVSPSLDLAACADAIERRSNRLYQRSFMKSLRRRILGKQKLYPEIYDTSELHLVRTIREFDDLYTARHGGFKNAVEYYEQSSALQFVPGIRVPTLIIHAQDDPFIPFESFRHPSIAGNPDVILLAPRRGGHVAFVADAGGVGSHGEDRYWAENRIVEFFSLLRRG